MKKVWKKIGLALIALTITSQAHALILIEPYGGYNFSLNGEENIGGTTSDFDFSGIGYGARLGIQLVTIMFGASYDIMDLDFDNDTNKVGVEQTNFGAFVGWNPKLSGIRFWGEYFFDVKNDYDVEGVEEQSGDGFGLGLGWKFNPWLALNAEYRSWKMDEPNNTDVTGESIFVSLSLPFDIL